jgi:hypothetical protein
LFCKRTLQLKRTHGKIEKYWKYFWEKEMKNNSVKAKGKNVWNPMLDKNSFVSKIIDLFL